MIKGGYGEGAGDCAHVCVYMHGCGSMSARFYRRMYSPATMHVHIYLPPTPPHLPLLGAPCCLGPVGVPPGCIALANLMSTDGLREGVSGGVTLSVEGCGEGWSIVVMRAQ